MTELDRAPLSEEQVRRVTASDPVLSKVLLMVLKWRLEKSEVDELLPSRVVGMN